VIDVYSRRLVGWALTTHLRTDLPLEALEMRSGRATTAWTGWSITAARAVKVDSTSRRNTGLLEQS
jgi:transposase InsO family protein